MLLTPERCREVSDVILKAAVAPEVSVFVSGGRAGLLRFAVNNVTQHQERDEIGVNISVAFGKREGAASTNRIDKAGLIEALRQAEAAAKLSPENPEHMPPLGPQTYADGSAAWDEASANLDPAGKARAVGAVCKEADRAGTFAAGLYDDYAGFSHIATSAGLRAYHRATSSGFSTTARTADGTGSARRFQAGVCRNRELPAQELGHEAITTAIRTVDPKPLPAGKYTVILAPPAWQELMDELLGALDARSVDEKRSCLYDAQRDASRLDTKVLGENITLRSQFDHPELVAELFEGDGLPARNTTWFEKGVLRNLRYSRFWAQKQGKQATPWPSHLVVDGDEHSFDDLVRGTERGVLISNIWYVRLADPKDITVTGLTRDGTFWIEDGKIQHPVNNFRFNDSPLRILGNVSMLSRPSKCGDRMLPFMQVRDFNFHSVSKAV